MIPAQCSMSEVGWMFCMVHIRVTVAGWWDQ
jgi:hypothetical protein